MLKAQIIYIMLAIGKNHFLFDKNLCIFYTNFLISKEPLPLAISGFTIAFMSTSENTFRVISFYFY
jgi:hypothetical protein